MPDTLLYATILSHGHNLWQKDEYWQLQSRGGGWGGGSEKDLTAIKIKINVICLKKAGKFVRFPSVQNYDDGH